MRPAHLLIALLIFVSGIASGWWLAHQQPVKTTNTKSSVPPGPQQTQVINLTPAHGDVIWLTVETDNLLQNIPAVILKDQGLMVASLYKVYPARKIYWRDRKNGQLVHPEVVAANGLIKLIALSWQGSTDTGMTLSNDSGSLFLGKDAVLRLPNERIPATVQSALIRDADGAESFRVELQKPTSGKDGPLTDGLEKTLIGYLIESRDDKRPLRTSAYAVDAMQIADLLDNHRLPAAMNIDAFNRYWFSTPEGIRLAAYQRFENGDWAQAYQMSENLWRKATDFRERDQRTLTTSAYRHALQLVDDGAIAGALNLAGDMIQRFPEAKAWCMVRARAYRQRQEWQSALAQVQRCLDSPPRWRSGDDTDLQYAESNEGLIALHRELTVELAKDPTATSISKQTALQKALDLQTHPHLHRLLGDLHYDSQRYAQARHNYEAAISLDPSLRAQLSNQLQNSRQRAATVPVTELPFETRRGAIIVSGRLNDSPQSFRFLVDTGATYSAVSRATLLRLGLNEVFSRGAPVIELESAAGPIYAQRFTIESIALGAARVEHVPVVILDNLEGVDGLIGLSFLRHFGVDLDQQAGKLILTRL